MLSKRIITAVIGMTAAIYIVNFGQWVFAAVVLFVTLLAWFEYCAILRQRNINTPFLLGFFPIVFLWAAAWLGNPQETVAILLFSVFAVLAKMVLIPEEFSVTDATFTITGFIYIGVTFSHLIMLRFSDSYIHISTGMGIFPAGAVYLWLALIGTWASDTVAYFIGINFGKHKLAPAISPAKTWEGTAGGVLGSFIALLVLGMVFGLSLVHCAIVGILVGFAATLGDLAESSIKRFAGVKDSGTLLPGHGGVLDRFDSIMFVVPMVYYYIYFLIQLGGKICKNGSVF